MGEIHQTGERDNLESQERSLERNPLVADSEWHDIPDCCGAWESCVECQSCVLEKGCRIVTATGRRSWTPIESEWL